MKPIYLILVLVFASIGFAALPDIVTDPATRDTIEYLDAKVKSAEDVTRNFSSATSTVTISGWVDVGWVLANSGNLGTAATQTLSCGSGLKIIGGGCDTGGTDSLRASYPSNNTTWTCIWGGTAGDKYVRTICARIK